MFCAKAAPPSSSPPQHRCPRRQHRGAPDQAAPPPRRRTSAENRVPTCRRRRRHPLGKNRRRRPAPGRRPRGLDRPFSSRRPGRVHRCAESFQPPHQFPGGLAQPRSRDAEARFFTHQQDRPDANAQPQRQILRALQLDALGLPMNADTTPPPCRRSRPLETHFPGTKQDSKKSHTSVIFWCSAATLARVWRCRVLEPFAPSAP